MLKPRLKICYRNLLCMASACAKDEEIDFLPQKFHFSIYTQVNKRMPIG